MMITYCTAWISFGLVCLLLELMVPGLFFCLSLALATTLPALCAWYDIPLLFQMIAFVISACIAFFILYLSAGTRAQKDIHYKSAIDALPGKKGFVTQKIFQNHVGQVQVEGQIWSAQSVHQELLEEGTSIVVIRVEGVRLIVKTEK